MNGNYVFEGFEKKKGKWNTYFSDYYWQWLVVVDYCVIVCFLWWDSLKILAAVPEQLFTEYNFKINTKALIKKCY